MSFHRSRIVQLWSEWCLYDVLQDLMNRELEDEKVSVTIGKRTVFSTINTNVGKLYDFIDLYLEKVNARMFKMHSMGILNIHRGYFNLLYQAVQYYPNFDIKVTEMFESGLKQWEVVVKHAVESGEIKSSCNAYEVAQTFRYLYSGLSFENSLYLGLDVDRLRILFYSYYNKIKNEN